ncbi:MAG TPA: TonB-dependent receptor, partial [Planctomycetota bacterium]|nr:TonB-dependent receptor [Planctomycetota bacterium]
VERTEEEFVSDFGGGFGDRGDRDNTGGFFQVEAEILEALLVTLSGRSDNNSFFGSEASWRAAAAYLIRSSGTKIRGTWGTGITAPAFLDLLGLFGNPDLLPEEASGGDVGVDQTFLEGSLRVGLTGYYNSIKNLIQGFPPVNVGRARTRGIELSAEVSPGKDGWFARCAYTLLRAKDEATGLDLIRRPRHEARLGAGYREAALAGWIDVVYVGDREDINFSTFARETVDGFFKIDLSGRIAISQDTRLTLRIENALDSKYEEVRGFPGAELNAMLGVEFGAH